MANETKNIISRNTCKKELLRLAKLDIFMTSVLLAILSLPFVLLCFFGTYIFKEIIVLGIFCFVIFAAGPVYYTFKLINNIVAFRKIDRGEFSVVTDTVNGLSKGEAITKNCVADVIYFTNYGRYVPSQTTFDLSAIGDEFYLVITHEKNKEPKLVFHSHIYEYKELD